MAKKATDDDMILKLSRPYAFEEETIEELDFSGFESVTTKDMIEASDVLTKSGRVVVNPEMDLQYCLYIAAFATGKPHEFFDQLKVRDAVRVKNKIRNCFFGSE
jgi:hypothetical protein